MPEMEPTSEINRIRVVLDNFNWKITQQVITDDRLVLTIQKDSSSDSESDTSTID